MQIEVLLPIHCPDSEDGDPQHACRLHNTRRPAKATASAASWPGAEGFEGDQRAQSFPEPSRQNGAEGKKLFCRSGSAHELQRNC